MNPQDRCFCELAPLYALGLLDEQQRLWVEAQVLESPELAIELAELEATSTALSYSLAAPAIAPDLKGRLFQQLEQAPSELSNVLPFVPRPKTPSVKPPRRVRWTQIAGTIAAITTIALLADNWRLRQGVRETQTVIAALQQPNTLTYSLKGTENAANASGSLVVNPSQSAIVVLVQNLPELPAGQAYRLWAITAKTTQPYYCGQFTSRASGATVRLSPPEAACRSTVAQMLITAESDTAPLVPAGSLVMKGTVTN